MHPGDRGATRVAVVVSAMGGKPKVTDLLLDLVHASAVRNLNLSFIAITCFKCHSCHVFVLTNMSRCKDENSLYIHTYIYIHICKHTYMVVIYLSSSRLADYQKWMKRCNLSATSTEYVCICMYICIYVYIILSRISYMCVCMYGRCA